MKTTAGKSTWFVLAAVWIASGVLYGVMPERVATHWNAQGVVNGYSGKMVGVFLLPVIMTIVQGFFMVIPRIDPLKKNSESFKKQLEGLMLLFALFMMYIFGVSMLWNMDIRFDMNRSIAIAFAGLLYGLGIILKKVKRNWFVGIRTPWTMSSDYVWDKTHAIGGELFKLSGVIALLGLVVPHYAIVLMIVPVLASSLWAVVYSYIMFKRQK